MKKTVHAVGYFTSILGTLLLFAGGFAASDWTELRGPAQVAASSAAFLGSATAYVFGWRLLHQRWS